MKPNIAMDGYFSGWLSLILLFIERSLNWFIVISRNAPNPNQITEVSSKNRVQILAYQCLVCYKFGSRELLLFIKCQFSTDGYSLASTFLQYRHKTHNIVLFSEYTCTTGTGVFFNWNCMCHQHLKSDPYCATDTQS